mgnify:FL=1
MEEMTTQSLSKQADISLLRIVATIAVVFLHTNSTLTEHQELFQQTGAQYNFFLCSHLVLHWAVPVFLMITGALLLKKEKVITYGICIKKYCKRILLALFIFGVPFSMIELFMSRRTVSWTMPLQSLMNVITGNSFSHLWYLYALIGLYLVLPFFKAALDDMSEVQLQIFLLILFIFAFCLPCFEMIGVEIAFTVPITYTAFYAVLGKYLYEKDGHISKFICLLALLVCLIVVCVFRIDGYDHPITAVESICIFLLFKGLSVKNEVRKQRLWKLDRLCFGVYLIHPVFIHFTYRALKITPISFGDMYWLMMFVFGVAYIACAFMGSWLMAKIKPLREYVL